MFKATTGLTFSYWNGMIENLQESPKSFYDRMTEALNEKQINGVRIKRVDIKEGGVLSAKREYLEVRRKKLVFHVCGAPFGNGFFVSWWLGEKPSVILEYLSWLPVVGRFAMWLHPPVTYYKMDTASMFQRLMHNAFMETVDEIMSKHGIRGFTDLERQPTVRDLLPR